MPVVNITSDYKIDDIENHFRISAGPGAGKTYWLSEHIKNVSHNSERLCKSRKIACITYTNIGVETILKRLGASNTNVEVTTIHSFLYSHIVKPYASFIAEEYGLDVSKMDGHDDIILSGYKFLNEWKTRTRQPAIRDDIGVAKAIKKARWQFDDTNNLVVKPPFPMKVKDYRYPIKTDSYFEYKKMAWAKGVVHHDDVLFLSYHIIIKFPFVLKVLRAKFPYYFVDEFQDSNPIQVEILKLIGQEETVVGVIGDKAQSIYGFQGAEPSQFASFNLNGINDYAILPNRRSTNNIIGLLNNIRVDDIVQTEHRNVEGDRPIILIGDMEKALRKAKEICQLETVFSLSRDNITSNAMKREINGTNLDSKLFEKLLVADKASSSNKYRSRLIASCIKSIELAKQGKFKESISTLEKEYKYIKDNNERRKRVLSKISTLMSKYEDYKHKTLYDFFTVVKSDINPEISQLTNRGAGKAFYDAHTYEQMALCVTIPEDLSQHKTIHKSKGDEFKNVLLILKEKSNLNFLINPDIFATNKEGEEQRIYYVAVSRAEDRLFISIPELESEDRTQLDIVFDIVDV
jgi:DNA helicase-2/ATP-dependent DNA helicase PcrA